MVIKHKFAIGLATILASSSMLSAQTNPEHKMAAERMYECHLYYKTMVDTLERHVKDPDFKKKYNEEQKHGLLFGSMPVYVEREKDALYFSDNWQKSADGKTFSLTAAEKLAIETDFKKNVGENSGKPITFYQYVCDKTFEDMNKK